MFQWLYSYGGKEFHIGQVNDHIAEYSNYKKITRKACINPGYDYIEALDFFFYSNLIDNCSKKGVTRIEINQGIKVIALQMKDTSKAFIKIEELFVNTGWYFFLTGVELEDSLISIAVDEIDKKYSVESLKEWSFNKELKTKLLTICSAPNANSFLLSIGGKNILLDAGLNFRNRKINYINKIKYLTNGNLDLIFLSHSHKDHYSGIFGLNKEFPNTVILCSNTTLDYIIFKRIRKEYLKKGEFKIKTNSELVSIIQKTITVKPNDKIELKNGYMKFYPSGHMPGSLMLEISNITNKILYTGDFLYKSIFPLTSVEKVINEMSKGIDLIILDGSMSSTSRRNNSLILSDLLEYIKKNAMIGKRILISADPASTAIVLALAIDKYFQELQKLCGFNRRPLIVMDADCKEYAKILQYRKCDLHPQLQDSIKKQMNPFMIYI